ncbi:unnamed protein product [Chironomus riparius]|uniref:Uncharacterized protein n=1 Tax=Chironomus riparius TaxID=315576 RepID=A0A9N9WX89_9DIPT|nr:unnamed protein product [Chironomus riparius]
MTLSVVIALTIVTGSYWLVTNAQTDKSYSFDDMGNGTITCEINGEKFYGDECLDSLKKFGKIVGYIVCGVLIIIVICCCGCWCCICKVIHSNKHRAGVVFQRNPAPPPNAVISTVA